VPHFPRFRALALFGRRPPQRVDSIVMPASENLRKTGLRDVVVHLGVCKAASKDINWRLTVAF